MRSLLEDAVAELNLAPGQTYRATVNGTEVQIHRPAEKQPAPPPDERSQFEDMVMMDLRLDVPPTPNAIVVTVTRGEPLLPGPYRLDESDLAPE